MIYFICQSASFNTKSALILRTVVNICKTCSEIPQLCNLSVGALCRFQADINHMCYHLIYRVQWFRQCTTMQEVAGSIPHGVVGIRVTLSLCPHSVTPRSTQSLAERSTKDFLGSKGGRCVRQTLPSTYADCRTPGSLNVLEPSRPSSKFL